jgi:hypothetical protein
MHEGAAILGVHAQRHAPSPALTRGSGQDQKDDRERRLELLIRRLPRRLRDAVRWLRQPAARWRLPVDLLLIVGGVFSILPVLGLWMLPLGSRSAGPGLPARAARYRHNPDLDRAPPAALDGPAVLGFAVVAYVLE